MPEKKFGIDLKSYDDIFKTEEEREEDILSKIRDIPISEIDDFPDHPFMVRDDEDMQNLIESIKERGVITPAMVRKKEDGRYELISGHRRKRACQLAGMDTLRCEVVDMDRDEAFGRLSEIVEDILELEPEDVSEDLSQENCDEWDSLAQMTLMVSVENEFGVKFNAKEMAELKSVKSILDFLV